MLLMIWGFPWLVSVPSFRSKIGADCERGGHEHKQEGQYESDVSKCAYTCIHMYICMKKNRNMLHRYERAKRKDDIHLTSILSVSGSVHVVREMITWSRNYWWTWAEFINFLHLAHNPMACTFARYIAHVRMQADSQLATAPITVSALATARTLLCARTAGWEIWEEGNNPHNPEKADHIHSRAREAHLVIHPDHKEIFSIQLPGLVARGKYAIMVSLQHPQWSCCVLLALVYKFASWAGVGKLSGLGSPYKVYM